MKKLYIGTNLKMYKTINDVKCYLNELQKLTKDIDRNHVEVFVLPSYTALLTAVNIINKKYIKIGAQNMCWEDTGQFTGEISPLMLKEINIDIVMTGHSERRHIFRECDQEENKKILSALKHRFTALLCIGETKEEKKYNISDEVLKQQLKVGLYNVEKKDAKNIMIGYEPVWSIGVDGEPASAAYAQEKHAVIKDTLKMIFGEIGMEIPVLYGGSVNVDNAEQLITERYVDGLYVGRSAWNAENFNKLIRIACRAFDMKFTK